MADETTAMVQMLSLTMNGAEKCIRGSAAVIKVLAKVFWQIYLKLKQRIDLLPGERTMMRFALDGKSLQCVTMNKEQFDLFKKNSNRYHIQYHHINNKKGKNNDLVTVFIPESDAHKFNKLVSDLKLNSIENLGTVQAEDVHPFKKPDMSTILAENIDKEGNIDLFEIRNNLIKAGMDPDEADIFVDDFLDSKEFKNSEVKVNISGISLEASKEQTKEAETSEFMAPAEEITENYVVFDAKPPVLSNRDWSQDRVKLEERKNDITSSIKSTDEPAVSEFKMQEISNINQIIEHGDNGNFGAIENDAELSSKFISYVGTDATDIPNVAEDAAVVSTEVPAAESDFSDTVEDIIDTKPITGGMEGGHGTTNYSAFVSDPSKIGKIDTKGVDVDINPNIPSSAPGL